MDNSTQQYERDTPDELDYDFSNASMISIFKKVKNTDEYNKKQEELLEATSNLNKEDEK